MNGRTRQILAGAVALTLAMLTHAVVATEGRADAPAGQMTWGT